VRIAPFPLVKQPAEERLPDTDNEVNVVGHDYPGLKAVCLSILRAQDVPIPDAPEAERQAIANLARACGAVGVERYQGQVNFQRRLLPAFSAGGAGQLNQKAEARWNLSLNQLGDALKQSFKLPTNPMKNPRAADEWEPYLREKRDENTRLTRALARTFHTPVAADGRACCPSRPTI
jgi:hypothetical protein